MLVLKIIGIIIILIILFAAFVSAYASGIMRGLTFMTKQGVKKNDLERTLINRFFKSQFDDVDPYFKNFIIKKGLDEKHKEIKDLMPEVAKKRKKKATAKKTKGGKK